MNVTASSMQQNSLSPITPVSAAVEQQLQGKYPYGTFSSQQQQYNNNNSNRFGANYDSSLNSNISNGVNNYTSNNNNNNIGSNLISSSPNNIRSSNITSSNTSGNNGNQAVCSDYYSNSNRNLITQKFVPLGENTNNSSPALLSNCHNNSQSFGGASSGRANNNITNTNSHLNSLVGSSSTTFSPVSVGNIPSHSNNSHRTNGTYGTEAFSSSSAAAANGVSHKISPIISNAGCYQIKNSGAAGDHKLQPKLSSSSSDKRSNGDNDELSSSIWNNSCIYKNTGSTLESLNLSARGLNYGNGNVNGNNRGHGTGTGLTRDEMKDQLAHSLATDKQINILPGFKKSGESSSSSWLPSYSPSTPSINYGRQQQQELERSTKDKTNNSRLSSPISRAQHAIGQSRKELGQVRSMMEMSSRINNRDSYNNVGIGGSFSARLPKARNLLTMDTETFMTKKAKQQSYRVDLERQIEQSKIRKNEIRRLDLEGDHPLGVKYNSPTPNNYLDDSIKSPRMSNLQQTQNPSDKIAKDYGKYLDFMSKRETLAEEKPRQYQQQTYSSLQKSTPNAVAQYHVSPSPRNIPQSQQEPIPQPKVNSMQHPHPHQQFQQQSYQHPPQSYFPVAPQPQYYYQPPYPYYPHPMQQAPAPAACYDQGLQINAPVHPMLNPFQGHQGHAQQRQIPNINQAQIPQQQRIPIQAESRPCSPKSFPEQVKDSINKNKMVHQPKHNKDSFDFLTEEEEDSNTEELEQSLRLHVWQESDQMPDPELRTNLYKRDLMKQIFQKKKEQMARKAKEIEEDEKIEKKILEYQRKMQKEVEEERLQLNLMNQIRQRNKGHHHHNRNQHDPQFRLRGQPQYLHSKHHHCQRYNNEENMDEYSQITNTNNPKNEYNSDITENVPNEFQNNNPQPPPLNSFSDESIVSGSGCSSDDFISSNNNHDLAQKLVLPTLSHNNPNNIAKRVETAAAAGTKQLKIVDDIQLLTNVHKILKMEAKRVLKEKKRENSLS